MLPSRTAPRALRATRNARLQQRLRYPHRTYADNINTSPAAAGGSALTGGLIGGGTVLAVAYGYYHFSGAKTAVQTMRSTTDYFKQAKDRALQQAPEPNEALEWLRSTVTAYVGFIPGAKGYVDTAFKDLDAVRSKHGNEVDEIVRDSYNELKEVSKGGDMSLDTAQKVWNVLERTFQQIGNLAGDAIEDILNNHPKLKEQVGGNIDQLRQLQDQYGPKVKEEVDRTWEQISGIISKGVSASTATDIKKVVDEKVQKIKELGDKAYNEGLEQVKPYLEKSPQVKKLVEENADTLKQGNLGELWDKVKDAVNTGNTEEFEKYIQSATEKAKSTGKKYGFDVEKYLNRIPGGGEIFSKIQQLQDIAQKHGDEAQKILSSTTDEIKQVLQKKTKEAEKVAEKAKKDAQE